MIAGAILDTEVLDGILQCGRVTLFRLHRKEGDGAGAFACLSMDEYGLLSGEPEAVLSDSELGTYSALKSEARRRGYFMGRYAAKCALAALSGIREFRELRVLTGVFGQPMVVCPAGEAFEISLTHGNGLAAAVAHSKGHPIGVDLEGIKEKNRDTLVSQLTATERELGFAIGRNAVEWYTLVWTAKESLSKILRCGLTVPFHLLELKNVLWESKSGYLSHYTNFPQYKCLSRIENGVAFSLALPARTSLEIQSETYACSHLEG